MVDQINSMTQMYIQLAAQPAKVGRCELCQHIPFAAKKKPRQQRGQFVKLEHYLRTFIKPALQS